MSLHAAVPYKEPDKPIVRSEFVILISFHRMAAFANDDLSIGCELRCHAL